MYSVQNDFCRFLITKHYGLPIMILDQILDQQVSRQKNVVTKENPCVTGKTLVNRTQFPNNIGTDRSCPVTL